MSEGAPGSIGVVRLGRMGGHLAGQTPDTLRRLIDTGRLIGTGRLLDTGWLLNMDEHLPELQGYKRRGNAAEGSFQPGADPAKRTQQTASAAGTCSATPDKG